MDVKLTELKFIVDALLDKLIAESETGYVTISDEKDYYWEVLPKSLFMIDQKPEELGIGRLSDDWEFLRPLLTEKHRVLDLTLMHVAPILRYLSGEE